jgi:hypothetical protein
MAEAIQNRPATVDARLPVTYEAAQKALAECSRVDECKDWSDKAAALASYARQAKDNTLHNLALRIQARAQRRMGELLKQVPRGDSDGANLLQNRRAATVPPVTRTQVAAGAGLSERQRKTALRVANVPETAFTAAVESPEPPTVTELARMGTSRKASAPEPTVQPADRATASRALGLLRELAAFCAMTDAPAIALACQDPDVARGHVEEIDRWLDRFVTRLATAEDGEAFCKLPGASRESRACRAAEPARPSEHDIDDIDDMVSASISGPADAQEVVV